MSASTEVTTDSIVAVGEPPVPPTYPPVEVTVASDGSIAPPPEVTTSNAGTHTSEPEDPAVAVDTPPIPASNETVATVGVAKELPVVGGDIMPFVKPGAAAIAVGALAMKVRSANRRSTTER